ncbi:MAG TPA: glycosyltransferase, partial [Chitinophagales bacterium]
LRLINIKNDIEKPLAGKKFPLKVGVEAASYDIIVTTDADCKPLTSRWLRHIAIEFMQETDFVLGYAPFNKASGFLNKIIRYDNVIYSMKYLAFSLAGMPFAATGRNMAFRKNAFLEWKGYSEKAGKILAGDDDLFINANAKKTNAEIALNKDSFMYSNAETSWDDWTFQKMRHAKSFSHYKIHHQFVLIFLALTTFAFYCFPITFFFIPQQAVWALTAGIFVYLMRLYTHIIICNKLNNEDLPFIIILLDLIQVLMTPVLFINTITTKIYRWK